MELTFTKKADRTYATLALRQDGVLLSVSNSDRKARLPHDIAHFIVERGLRLKRGFWGRVAMGGVYAGMKVLSGRQRPHAAERSRQIIREEEQQGVEAEVLVGLLMQLVEAEQETSDTAIKKMLKEAWRPMRPERSTPDIEEVKRVCAELRVVRNQWLALEPGESLTFTWPFDRLGKHHCSQQTLSVR